MSVIITKPAFLIVYQSIHLKSVCIATYKSRSLYGLESISLYSVIFTTAWSTVVPTREGPEFKNIGLKPNIFCRIFKWSVHVVNKGSSVCEIWGSYSDDSFKYTIFWDAALFRLGVHYPHFGGACCLHLQRQMAWASRLHSTTSHKTEIIVHHHIYKMLTSSPISWNRWTQSTL